MRADDPAGVVGVPRMSAHASGPPAAGGGDASRPGGVYALLADGATVEIRPAAPGDFGAVLRMHRAMSPENIYFRFFSASSASAEPEARRICRPAAPDHVALLARLAGELVGVASYEAAGAPGAPGAAEIAFAVADHVHHRGVATLLLEHLVSAAGRRGVRAFTAEVLAENYAMLKLFASVGLRARRSQADGVTELVFDLPGSGADPGWEPYLEAVAQREGRAEVASLRHVLAPESVAVVGASRRPGSVGRAILRNIVSGGFTGPVYAVNPHASDVEGVRCVPSAASLPGPVDLAVVAVPARAVLAVAQECGQRGIGALVVITSGLDLEAREALLGCCRRHGMRLVGPNCLGVAVPGIGLDATFAARHPAAGAAGLAVQSGGVGIALAGRLSRLGIGISSFASLGDKADVSGNDLLRWWEQDPATKLAVLYLESFGNPRKFGRSARRLGAAMPVLTVHAARSEAGQRAAATHIAAAATPVITQEALFRQAGVIAARDIGELIEAAALLASQPVPAAGRVAVVSNAGGAGVLAADACSDAGLHVALVNAGTQDALSALLPPGADVAGPVDTTAAVPPGVFRRCLELLAADDGVDAVLALPLPTALADLVPAACSAGLSKPLVLSVLDQAEAVALLPGASGTVPAYAYPGSAARALAHAAGYGAWRARPPGQVPGFGDLRPADARLLISDFLRRSPAGGWLGLAPAAELLACYGIAQAAAPPMITGGTELIIGVMQEPVFGPLVVFGLGGAGSDVLDDRSARLTPLTDTDAAALIRSVRAAPLLLGHRGAPAADLPALQQVLMRLSRLADDLPQVAEVDLNPVIARPDGAYVAGARVRLVPAQPADPYLRRLR
jgi:acyl-CoA synthetase (NDP forming)/GNAT superfamily N-acetyltransferase